MSFPETEANKNVIFIIYLCISYLWTFCSPGSQKQSIKASKYGMVLFFSRHIVTQHLGNHFSQVSQMLILTLYINVNICVKHNNLHFTWLYKSKKKQAKTFFYLSEVITCGLKVVFMVAYRSPRCKTVSKQSCSPHPVWIACVLSAEMIVKKVHTPFRLYPPSYRVYGGLVVMHMW